VCREFGVHWECTLIGEQPGRNKFDGKAVLLHEFFRHRRRAIAPTAQWIEEIGKVSCLGHGVGSSFRQEVAGLVAGIGPGALSGEVDTGSPLGKRDKTKD
jgi:hypothetical protein